MNTEQPTPPAVVLSTALLNPLPCPFCGHVGLEFKEGSTFRWIIAECGGCGASRGETRIQTFGEGTRDEWMADVQADAIQEWNTRAILAAARSQPVLEPLTECRIELVTAIQTLASHYENKCYKFQDDKEVLADAQGDIDHARQVASKWNWNGITQGGKV